MLLTVLRSKQDKKQQQKLANALRTSYELLTAYMPVKSFFNTNRVNMHFITSEVALLVSRGVTINFNFLFHSSSVLQYSIK